MAMPAPVADLAGDVNFKGLTSEQVAVNDNQFTNQYNQGAAQMNQNYNSGVGGGQSSYNQIGSR